jgi:membrane protease subunit HflC
MRAERTAVAKAHRSQGQEQAEIIRATIDAKVTIMIAEAKKNSFIVRGEGDADAAKIYSNAYQKDAEFYAFYRSLEAYKNSFNSKNDIMVMKPDSEFFRFLKDGAKASK